MQRYDFFFRQKVTEAELDAAFDAAENALFNFALDVGIVGITSGGAVAENAGTPNLTVDIGGPASIYDQSGQRINWTGTQDVDCSVDENSNSTAVTTPGNEKWLSVFAKFERSLSDSRLDGNGASVFFNRAESFSINVVQGAESAAPATRPSTRADEILLADIKLIFGQTQILNADIDTTRRQDWTNDATTIEFTGPSNNWHDGSNLATNTLDGVINAIVDALADEDTDGKGGADRIGTREKTVGAMTLTAGSVDDQIVEILGEIQQLKKDRAYMQINSLRLRREVFDEAHLGSGRLRAISFSTHENPILTSSVAAHMLVGYDGTAGKVIAMKSLVGSSGNVDVTANLINAPDNLYDGIYIPSSNRHIIVGRIDASSGADIETCDDEIGTAWTSRTPTGMTAAGDAAYVAIHDPSNGAVIVGGANGKIIRSVDDGASWASATTIPAGLGAFRWQYAATNGMGDVLLLGDDTATVGKLLHSSDGGDTWTDVTPAAIGANSYHVIWEPVAQRFLFNWGTSSVYRSTNTAGTAWAVGPTGTDNTVEAWVTDGQSGVIFGFSASATEKWMYATEDLGVTFKVGMWFENNPSGATHTSSGWEDGGPDQITAYKPAYFADGRFWLLDSTSVWVSPAIDFTRIGG